MSMSQKALSGFGGSVAIDTSTAVEVVEWSADINYEDFASTHLGSSGFIEEKFLTKQITGTFEAHEAIVPNSSYRWMTLSLGSSGGTTGIKSIRGRMRHSLGITNPQEKIGFSHSFKSTGPFVITATA